MSIMDNLLDFLTSESRYEERYLIAKSTNTCLRCGKEAREFRDTFGKLEYSCSALCQSCQDQFGLVHSQPNDMGSKLNLQGEGKEVVTEETTDTLEKVRLLICANEECSKLYTLSEFILNRRECPYCGKSLKG